MMEPYSYTCGLTHIQYRAAYDKIAQQKTEQQLKKEHLEKERTHFKTNFKNQKLVVFGMLLKNGKIALRGAHDDLIIVENNKNIIINSNQRPVRITKGVQDCVYIDTFHPNVVYDCKLGHKVDEFCVKTSEDASIDTHTTISFVFIKDYVGLCNNIVLFNKRMIKCDSDIMYNMLIQKYNLTDILSQLDEKEWDLRLALKAATADEKNLKHIPSSVKTEFFWNELLSNDGNFLEYIQDPTDKQIEIAIDNDCNIAKYIKLDDLSEKILEKFVKHDTKYIDKIPPEKQTVKMHMIVIKKDCSFFDKLYNPSPQVRLKAISINPDIFFLIDSPTDEELCAIIRKDNNYIQYMDNPSNVVLTEYIKSGGSIENIKSDVSTRFDILELIKQILIDTPGAVQKIHYCDSIPIGIYLDTVKKNPSIAEITPISIRKKCMQYAKTLLLEYNKFINEAVLVNLDESQNLQTIEPIVVAPYATHHEIAYTTPSTSPNPDQIITYRDIGPEALRKKRAIKSNMICSIQ